LCSNVSRPTSRTCCLNLCVNTHHFTSYVSVTSIIVCFHLRTVVSLEVDTFFGRGPSMRRPVRRKLTEWKVDWMKSWLNGRLCAAWQPRRSSRGRALCLQLGITCLELETTTCLPRGASPLPSLSSTGESHPRSYMKRELSSNIFCNKVYYPARS
jgi:hypothetical protein